MTPVQQVTLVLRGSPTDIADVIQLALAGEVLVSMQQTERRGRASNPNVHGLTTSQGVSRHWETGMKVRVVALASREFPGMPPVGTEGIVKEVHQNGMKSAVSVQFLDRPKAVRIGGRLLKEVK